MNRVSSLVLEAEEDDLLPPQLADALALYPNAPPSL